jgi:hypothetical protein
MASLAGITEALTRIEQSIDAETAQVALLVDEIRRLQAGQMTQADIDAVAAHAEAIHGRLAAVAPDSLPTP